MKSLKNDYICVTHTHTHSHLMHLFYGKKEYNTLAKIYRLPTVTVLGDILRTTRNTPLRSGRGAAPASHTDVRTTGRNTPVALLTLYKTPLSSLYFYAGEI